MNHGKFTMFEFKLNTMVENPAILMIAKRGSGKSFIARDLIYHYRDIPGGVVISPTDRLGGFYKNFFPDLYIHYDIKDSLLKKILLRQKIIVEKEHEKNKIGKKIDARGILIMDDCLSRKKSWAKDETIIEILMNGRHYKLTYLLTMQTPLGITPDLRLNFDYIFLLKDVTMINQKKLYDNYASIFPSLQYFIKVFTVCTKDHCSMVIDNRSSSDNIQEKVFWFKAAERVFKFGSKLFKELHNKYYDPNYMKKSYRKLLNDTMLVKKRNDIEIDVQKLN